MFFVLSKIGTIVTAPPTIAIGMIVLSAILIWTAYTRAARALLTVGAVLLVALAFSPLQELVLLPLENRFPRAPNDLPPPTGIIVLGGALSGELARLRAAPPSLPSILKPALYSQAAPARWGAAN